MAVVKLDSGPPQLPIFDDGTDILVECKMVKQRDAKWLIDEKKPELGKKQQFMFVFEPVGEEYENMEGALFGFVDAKFEAQDHNQLYQWVKALLRVDDELPIGWELDTDELKGLRAVASLTKWVDAAANKKGNNIVGLHQSSTSPQGSVSAGSSPARPTLEAPNTPTYEEEPF